MQKVLDRIRKAALGIWARASHLGKAGIFGGVVFFVVAFFFPTEKSGVPFAAGVVAGILAYLFLPEKPS